MAKNRKNRFSFADDRKLIEMAAAGASMEGAARQLKTTTKVVQAKAHKSGISVRNGFLVKRHVGSIGEIGLKAKTAK